MAQEQVSKGWKTTAIVFMILFILETAFLLWAFNSGTKQIERETECGIQCDNEGYVYSYDSYENICYCIDKDSEIAKQFVVRI